METLRFKKKPLADVFAALIAGATRFFQYQPWRLIGRPELKISQLWTERCACSGRFQPRKFASVDTAPSLNDRISLLLWMN